MFSQTSRQESTCLSPPPTTPHTMVQNGQNPTFLLRWFKIWGGGQITPLCSSFRHPDYNISYRDVTILVITHHRSKAIGSLSSGLSHNLLTRTVHYIKILFTILVLVGYHINYLNKLSYHEHLQSDQLSRNVSKDAGPNSEDLRHS